MMSSSNSPSIDSQPKPTVAWLDSPGRVCGVYAVLAVVMTFPLAFRLTTHVPAGAVDLWQNVWNFWWWRQCMDAFHPPYLADVMFHPTGANAAFHTHSMFNMVAAMPVNLMLGETAAYNFCVLMALWLSGFTMWLLAREVTGDSMAAFLAGLIYAFFPNHMEQTLEHLNLFSIQFIPLSIYFLVRIARRGGNQELVGLGAAYGMNALADWHLAIKLTALLLAVFIYFMIRAPRSRWAILRDTVLAAMLAITIALPAAWPLIWEMAGSETFFMKTREDKGIDAYYFFLPYYNHPVFGGLTREAYAIRAYEAAGFASYLGYTAVALGLIGCAVRARRAWMWLVLFAVSLLLAAGKHPQFHGVLHEDISLPFGWMERIPLLKLMRVANRFMIPAGLALAMLAAWGWNGMRRAPRWAGYVIAALILFEFMWIPYPLQEIVRPDFLKTLRDDPAQGAVLDIPFTPNGQTVENMRYQTAHERPIVGGYLSTLPPEPMAFLESEPAFADLMGIEPTMQRAPELKRLAEFGVAFIVMHKDRTAAYAAAHLQADPTENLFQRKLDTRIGGMTDEKFASLRAAFEADAGAPIHEDDLIVVFRIPNEAKE